MRERAGGPCRCSCPIRQCRRPPAACWRAITPHQWRHPSVDRDSEAIRELNEAARERRLPLRADVRDLEGGETSFHGSTFDVIVVVHYLHRPLFPALIEALAPGGLLVYETFTRAQAARGKPTNPDFLLKPGELLELVGPLEVLASREGDFDGRMVASVVARRTP